MNQWMKIQLEHFQLSHSSKNIMIVSLLHSITNMITSIYHPDNQEKLFHWKFYSHENDYIEAIQLNGNAHECAIMVIIDCDNDDDDDEKRDDNKMIMMINIR